MMGMVLATVAKVTIVMAMEATMVVVVVAEVILMVVAKKHDFLVFENI